MFNKYKSPQHFPQDQISLSIKEATTQVDKTKFIAAYQKELN